MFDSVGLPHGFCFLWNPRLLWLHVASDGLIALSYFLIPVVMIGIVRKRKDLPFNGIFFCFAAFIVACGITHIMEIVTLWQPVYWVSGGLKAITAAVSLATLFVLARLTPTILAIPTEGALARANRELTSVLESTTMCVVAMDESWKLTYLNTNAKKVLRLQTNVYGKPLFEAFPAQSSIVREKLEAVMASREPVEYESYYPPLDLSTIVRAHPAESGGITIFFSDVSDQKRLLRQLEIEKALREHRIASLAQMAGGLAHEISNPLGIIHARASDLEELATACDSVPAATVTAACTSIVKTSDRAIRILRGLKMFAREGSRDPMQPASIGNLVEQTVDLVQRRYATHGIALDVAPISVPDVMCREVQVGQIVLNLLNNAFDAIDSATSSERWVRIYAREAGEFVVLDVVDGGPGVASEHRAHLMEPFYTTKPVGAGMGVGLSLSRTIAQDHGGSLELTDVEGHTCFRLTLPILPGPADDGAIETPVGFGQRSQGVM